jgi:hypothetical protein
MALEDVGALLRDMVKIKCRGRGGIRGITEKLVDS